MENNLSESKSDLDFGTTQLLMNTDYDNYSQDQNDLTEDYFTGGHDSDDDDTIELNMRTLESTLLVLDKEMQLSGHSRDDRTLFRTKSSPSKTEISPSSPPTPPPSPRGNYTFKSDTRGGILPYANDIDVKGNDDISRSVEESVSTKDSKYIFQKLITMKEGPLSTPYQSSNNVQKVDSYILSLLR